MVEISKIELEQIDESAKILQIEYEKAKKEYKKTKEKLKWIFEVKNCDHDVVCTGFDQLVTYECKKCKYVWYE